MNPKKKVKLPGRCFTIWCVPVYPELDELWFYDYPESGFDVCPLSMSFYRVFKSVHQHIFRS